MKIGIIGLGWFGLPLARHLAKSHQVCGSKSSEEAAAALRNEGLDAHCLQLTPHWEASEAASKALLNVDTVVLNIPPGMRSGGEPEYYLEQMKSVLDRLNGSPVAHLIFVSSTGVFGDQQISVDEDTRPEPSGKSGEVLREAEALFSGQFKVRTTILRPAGLIGGERHPVRYLAGRSGVKGRLHPVNLVHRNDLIALTEAIIVRKAAGNEVFHAVAMGHPSKGEYYSKAAITKGLNPPSFDFTDESPGKTVHGEKTKTILGLSFQYDHPDEMV